MSADPHEPDDEKRPDFAAEERLEREASLSMQEEKRRLFVLAACVVGFLLIAHFTPLQSWLNSGQEWKRYVDQFGLAAHLAFGIASMVAVMFGMPRVPLCTAAGAIFGFNEGFVISWLGSSLGSYGSFLLVRWGAKTSAEKRVDSWPWLRALMTTPTFWRVVLLRQLMVPGVVLNILLGITSIAHRVFIAGTLVGYLPLNIALTLVGSGLGKANLVDSLKQILAAIAIINVIAWIVVRLMKNKHP